MEARQGTLRSLAVVVLACALGLPAAQARANTPPESLPPTLEQLQQAAPEPLAPAPPPPDPIATPANPGAAVIPGGGEPALGAEEPELGRQPANQAEPLEPGGQPEQPPQDSPQDDSRPAPAPSPLGAPTPPAGAPHEVPVPAQPVAPDPPPPVPSGPVPPHRRQATPDRTSRLLSKVDILLRRVERSMKRVKSELDAGRKPADRSLRELRHNVDALTPALGVVEPNLAPPAGGELDIGEVERRLRRVREGAGALVEALARAGIDTPEATRLVQTLDRFSGVLSAERVPSGPSTTHVARGAARASAETGGPLAYTYAERAPAQSWSGGAGEEPVSTRSPRSLMDLANPAASGHFSTLGLAAIALLLAVVLSGSLSALVVSDWGCRTSTPALTPDRNELGDRTSAPAARRPRSGRLAHRP